MRILLAHNFYGSGAPSGENRVFELELDLLRRNGHEVATLVRHSDEIRTTGWLGVAKGGIVTPWNPNSFRAMRKYVDSFKPDVIHVHNTFPLLSPAIFPAARGSARVLTLHNYRLLCAAGIPMRQGMPCTECITRRSVVPGLLHGCYRGSRVATLPLAASIALHRARGTWVNDVDSFIALSDFQRELMACGGLPIGRIEVKPNFYPGTPDRMPFESRPERVVFAGRIGAEKGVEDLVEAWLAWGNASPELRIVGDGPMLADLREKASQHPNIRFLGALNPLQAQEEISKARLLLLPSHCFETFGMVLVEAFAYGVPVGVSDIGPLPSIVKPADGVIFPSRDPKGLLLAIQNVWDDPQRLREMARKSIACFEGHYTEQINYRQLMEIYTRAIELRFDSAGRQK